MQCLRPGGEHEDIPVVKQDRPGGALGCAGIRGLYRGRGGGGAGRLSGTSAHWYGGARH